MDNKLRVFVTNEGDIMGEIIHEDDKFIQLKFPFSVNMFIEACYNSSDHVYHIRQNSIVGEYDPSEALVKIYKEYFANGPVLSQLFDKMANKYIERAKKIRDKAQNQKVPQGEVNPNDDDPLDKIVDFKEYFKKNIKDE